MADLTRERKQHYLSIIFSGFLLIIVAILLMWTVNTWFFVYKIELQLKSKKFVRGQYLLKEV